MFQKASKDIDQDKLIVETSAEFLVWNFKVGNISNQEVTERFYLEGDSNIQLRKMICPACNRDTEICECDMHYHEFKEQARDSSIRGDKSVSFIQSRSPSPNILEGPGSNDVPEREKDILDVLELDAKKGEQNDLYEILLDNTPFQVKQYVKLEGKENLKLEDEWELLY